MKFFTLGKVRIADIKMYLQGIIILKITIINISVMLEKLKHL